VDGRYYLNNKGDNIPTSRGIWEHIFIHEILTFASGPLSLAAIGYIVYGYAMPAARGFHRSTDIDERIKAIRSASFPWATMRCHINVAGADSRDWYLVSVYPVGVLIRLNFLATAAIRTGEIRSIGPQTATATHKAGLQIRHAGRDIDSPIVLYVDVESPFAQAVQTLEKISTTAT